MYQVSEKPLDKMLMESTQLLSKLDKLPNVPRQDVVQFGSSVLAVQTEVQRQKKVRDAFGTD